MPKCKMQGNITNQSAETSRLEKPNDIDNYILQVHGEAKWSQSLLISTLTQSCGYFLTILLKSYKSKTLMMAVKFTTIAA